MSQPFVGEIRMFGGNFAPAGWMFCEGQLLSIAANDTLFNLIGTTYGGDGMSTFALPDLRGRLPVHVGPGLTLAQAGGSETVTLTVQQVPAHTHTLAASSAAATQTAPAGNLLAQADSGQLYLADTPAVGLNVQSVGSAGGSQPHSNLGPYLCVSFIISLFGIYPIQ